MGVLLRRAAVCDLLVLVLEVFENTRTIVSTVTLAPEADTIVIWLVVREFEEPSLRKVPKGMSRECGRAGCVGRVLAGEGADAVRQVSLWHSVSELCRDGTEVDPGIRNVELHGTIIRCVVREADLGRLVKI